MDAGFSAPTSRLRLRRVHEEIGGIGGVIEDNIPIVASILDGAARCAPEQDQYQGETSHRNLPEKRFAGMVSLTKVISVSF
jgi:hypothetical protein